MTLTVECTRPTCGTIITTTKVRFGSLNRSLYRNMRAHLEHIHGFSGRSASVEAERAVKGRRVVVV